MGDVLTDDDLFAGLNPVIIGYCVPESLSLRVTGAATYT